MINSLRFSFSACFSKIALLEKFAIILRTINISSFFDFNDESLLISLKLFIYFVAVINFFNSEYLKSDYLKNFQKPVISNFPAQRILRKVFVISAAGRF